MALARERDDEQTRFKRYGLGFQYRPPEAPVVMTFTSVSEKRGEVRAEVHVASAANGGHILRRYLNLLGSTSMNQLVKDLNGSEGCAAFPWARILESATESVIGAIRLGATPESFGGLKDRPPGISWLCEGLVMAGVPNVWLAAASTGKSTFAALLALHHAVGRPFLGRATTQGVSLYLDWESTGDDLAEKLWLGSRWLGYGVVPSGVYRMAMRGPASMHAASIANRIEEIGATLVIWDGVQAAGGSPGQYAGYETIALDLEALVGVLPPSTHVLLDHVTGDELKAGAVPLKARGGTRKVEWARNQWSLVLDREKHHEKRHVVGWSHTKINRANYFPSFGVEVLHRPDELGFAVLEEQEVESLKEKMSDWRQVLVVLREAGRPLMAREIAVRWLGEANEKTLKRVNRAVNGHRNALAQNDDATFQPREGFSGRVGANGTAAANGSAHSALETQTAASGGDPRFDSRGNWAEDEEWQDEQLPF